MMHKNKRSLQRMVFLAVVLLLGLSSSAQATIPGLTGTAFNFTAKPGYISVPDANSIYMWGYADVLGSGSMQYPGPTLILEQGVPVQIMLTNQLPLGQPVSIVFPGQLNVVATGGDQDGPLTRETLAGGTAVVYSFTPSQPGTFIYYSGSNMELQVEMGLFGAIIVRPTLGPLYAYNHTDTRFDREYLFLLSEIDHRIHEFAEYGQLHRIDFNDYVPVYWFINGRSAPDTMAHASTALLPNQPYNCHPMMHPGEKLLMRLIGGGRDLHPFHHHGNNSTIIARNGRLLESTPGVGADRAYSDFTISVVPGETVDSIFEWTGYKLGWDIYGDPNDPDHEHMCMDMDMDDFDDMTAEYCPDHGKPFPVVLPDEQALMVGDHYSGSPFLGTKDSLPPGTGSLNPNGSYFFMWHSHNEKEMVNNDIFPGGMMAMLVIEPHGVDIH